MSAKVQFWTEERYRECFAAYLDEITQRGFEGATLRLTNRLSSWGRSSNAMRQAMRRHKTWGSVHKQAMRADEEWRKKNPSEIKEKPKVDPTNEEIRRLERRDVAKSDQINDLRRKLKKQDRSSGIIEELVHVIDANLSPLDGVPNLPPKAKRDGQEEVDAVVMLSDQHADRVVREAGTWGLERYDFNAFRARLWEWAKVVKAYSTQHLPNYYFHTLWVWHLGDAVNGDIHNMKHRNDFGNSLKAAMATGDAQAQALAWLAPHFQRIVVVCIPGNHGRTTNQVEWEDPHDSFDYVTAMHMKARLRGTPVEDRVEIFTPRAWSAHVEVRGYLWHLNHGHGVKGTWGIPWYGFERREGRVQRLVSFKDRQVDYFAYGHFHTPMTRPTGRGKAVHAGSWYMTDEYALNQLAVGNVPEQQMLVFSERFGRQFEIPIMVRDQEREAKMYAGEWNPPFGQKLLIDEPASAALEMPIIT